MSNSVQKYNGNIAGQIAHNLATPGREEAVAGKVGDRLSKAEDAFMNAVSNPEASQKEIETAKLALQRAQSAFQAMQQVFDNFFQMTQRAIQSLSLR